MAFNETVAASFAQTPRVQHFVYEPFRAAESPNFGVGVANLARNDFIHAVPFERAPYPPGSRVEYTTLTAPGDPSANEMWPQDADPTTFNFVDTSPGNRESQPVATATNMARLTISVTMDQYQAQQFSSVASLKDVLTQGAVNLYLRELTRRLFNGTGSPTVTGLRSLILGFGASPTYPQVRDLASTAFGLADIMDLYNMVSPAGRDGTGGRADCIIVPPAVSNQMRKAELLLGGQPQFAADPRSGRNCYHFMGVPVYDADITPAAAELYEAYAAKLGGPDGIRVLYGADEELPYGMRIFPIVQNANAEVSVVITGFYGLLVPDFGDTATSPTQGSVAMLENFLLA